MVIVLSGGGTAGHITPALALAEELQSRGHTVAFAGTPDGIEARLVRDEGIVFEAFEAAGFDRARPTTLFSSTAKIMKSTRAAKRWLADVKPDAVVGFGGYVCVPVGRAAASLRIPLILHEQNSVMGMTNRYLSRKAAKVALTYEQSGDAVTDKDKVVVTGNPVRPSIFNATREQGRSFLGIPEKATVLLVFGGSRGARHLNEAIIRLKDSLLADEVLHVVHITGPQELDAVKEQLQLSVAERIRWHLFGYQDRMGDVYAAADAVVARAGATSLAEISARRIPALLVPFPYATQDHQTGNAKAYVEGGAALMIADDHLDTDAFGEKLLTLLEDERLREKMTLAAAAFDTRNAVSRLADVVIEQASLYTMSTI